MPRSSTGEDDGTPVSPDEAFALLGNDTRVGILQALWDAFESGTSDNALPYSQLFEEVDIGDSGNFSYHLERLTGPFVRRSADGYELKQTGINVVRAVVAGTVTDDPEFGPVRVDTDCPICAAPIEITYADELVTAVCTACEGALRWKGESGFLFLGLVPPAGVEQRPVERAFRATVTHTFREIAALADDVCPHCASTVETTLDVCPDHDPGAKTLCPTCDRRYVTSAWMVCTTCKRSAFPPARAVVLDHPAVSTFYYEHGIEYRFASWETVVRSVDVSEEILTEDPLEMRVRIPAGDDELRLTTDGELNVLEVTL
jgi:hypothetical protein